MRHDWRPPKVDDDAQPVRQHLVEGIKMCFEMPIHSIGRQQGGDALKPCQPTKYKNAVPING
jgi:hypothetical protein